MPEAAGPEPRPTASQAARAASARRQRARGRALWALVVGCIGLAATGLGALQYLGSGVVQVHAAGEPLRGAEALEALVAGLLTSAGFVAAGLAWRARARRRPGAR